MAEKELVEYEGANPFVLLKEHLWISKILPELEDDADVIGYNEIFLKKGIQTKKEIVDYLWSIEKKLEKSSNEVIKNYLANLKYDQINKKLDFKFSKLEQESILGEKILRNVWKRVMKNNFCIDTLGGDLFEPSNWKLEIGKYKQDIKIEYYLPGGNQEAMEIILYSTYLSSFLKEFYSPKKLIISKKASLKMCENNNKNLRLNQILNEINSQILKKPYSSPKLFKNVILNLPDIMNTYLNKKLKE